MAVTKIYTGAAFVEVRYKAYDGAVWIDVPKFWDGAAWVNLNSQGPVVTAGPATRLNSKSGGSACVTVVKWDADGSSYFSNNIGGFSAPYEVWLDQGLNSEVWVSRVITTGTLSGDSIGSGRPIMSSDRELRVNRSTNGQKQCTGTVTFWDAATGGNILDTATFNITAEWDDGQ